MNMWPKPASRKVTCNEWCYIKQIRNTELYTSLPISQGGSVSTMNRIIQGLLCSQRSSKFIHVHKQLQHIYASVVEIYQYGSIYAIIRLGSLPIGSIYARIRLGSLPIRTVNYACEVPPPSKGGQHGPNERRIALIPHTVS